MLRDTFRKVAMGPNSDFSTALLLCLASLQIISEIVSSFTLPLCMVTMRTRTYTIKFHMSSAQRIVPSLVLPLKKINQYCFIEESMNEMISTL